MRDTQKTYIYSTYIYSSIWLKAQLQVWYSLPYHRTRGLNPGTLLRICEKIKIRVLGLTFGYINVYSICNQTHKEPHPGQALGLTRGSAKQEENADIGSGLTFTFG